MHILQVVRRFGPVGGMETYVWHLSRELARSQCRVTVICEENCSEDISGVQMLFVPRARSKPRWLALIRFSTRVRRLIESNRLVPDLIHSHERTSFHHVTTFHGPPFAVIREWPIWKWLSIRVWAHLWLEQRELLGPQVRAVIPNSRLIANDLVRYYPRVSKVLVAAIPPGVSDLPLRSDRPVPVDGGVIGFVGKEWKRKGLDLVLQVFARLKTYRPKLRLLIIGPDTEVISELTAATGSGIKLIGWEKAAPYYQDMDLLLHPASQEPFGMVVIEAMAAKVPVVISRNCGASEYVSRDHGEVLSLDGDLDNWIRACDRQLKRSDSPPGFSRGWDQVAKEYLSIYRSVQSGLKGTG